jgi:D-alanyl-D-alanine carboxypeptidase
MAVVQHKLIARRLATPLAGLFVLALFAPCAQATPSVVIDVASGQILEQDQATASWYPASLTKLMTAYVALDAVRKGKIALDTPMMVSPRATRMAPSKMGFRPGTEVTLQNALVMLMVKSANDIAVTIAEGVSGSVEAFADDMNRASIALGMRESYWANPNGLPDSRQVTSARDLAMLGRALYVEFPQHAWLYNIGAMQLGRSVHATHNGLLGRYPGADGMKTGFTCPAGFNLVASATHGGQKLIAVVLGAPTAAARTAKAAALLDRAFHGAAAQGSIAGLPSSGVAAAPDMRDSVCHHRGKAHAEFMAEVEDMAIPIGSGVSTGIPLLDMASAANQPHVNVKEIAHLPRPRFEPMQIHVGRVEGYVGPTARTRAAGAPIGEQPDLSAYVEETPVEANASPIGRAAPDATPLRQRGGAGKHGGAKAKAAKGRASFAKTGGRAGGKSAAAAKPQRAGLDASASQPVATQ